VWKRRAYLNSVVAVASVNTMGEEQVSRLPHVAAAPAQHRLRAALAGGRGSWQLTACVFESSLSPSGRGARVKSVVAAASTSNHGKIATEDRISEADVVQGNSSK